MAGEIYHRWDGTVLTITSDSGTSSADLKGEKGDTGIRGPQGVQGISKTVSYPTIADKPTINGVEVSGDMTTADLGLQEKIIAGENIKIEGNKISTTCVNDVTVNGTSVLSNKVAAITLSTVAETGSYNDLKDKPDLSVYAKPADIEEAVKDKQETLVAGTNITIDGNVINAQLSGDVGVPIGTGMDYFGTTAPTNYMFADGRLLSRTEYAALFAIIGTTYGAGDGETTFNLPDKRKRVAVTRDEADINFDTLGFKGGTSTHTLTTAQIPSHTHTFTGTAESHTHTFTGIASSHTHSNYYKWGYDSGSTKYIGVSTPGVIQGDGTFNVASTTLTPKGTNSSTSITPKGTNSSTGSGQAHNNLQPYLVCNYIIKVK